VARVVTSAIPETRYARNDDIHLAYQTIGEGPRDLLSVISGPGSHVEQMWEDPAIARATRRLARYGRVILFDQRGNGLSDPVSPRDLPTMDQHVDDIRAVLDATGSKRAVVMGYLAGTLPAMVFAASHPERVESLILFGAYARLRIDTDYEPGVPPEVVDQVVQLTLEGWGKGADLGVFAPSMVDDERFRVWWGQMERLSASPGTAAALIRQWFDADVRSVLPAIRVPTLVLTHKNQQLVTAAHARYVADHIDGARYVELDGADLHFFTGDTEPVFEAIEDFLGAGHSAGEADRMLGTVLFLDIVGSTTMATQMGDLRWRDLLEAFNGLLNRQLERYHGRLVDTAGDGALALFDSPARAIACARAMRDGVRALGIEVRAGIHTGELERRDNGGIGGIAVHIGARIGALADGGEILVSRTIKDLTAGSSVLLESRGTRTLKGIPEAWEIYAVAE
jgi:class 3 adenylate cyclase/pimeloyl-ACP methyl ester carboxylesterase